VPDNNVAGNNVAGHGLAGGDNDLAAENGTRTADTPR
jgi:hypothetical protein